MPPKCPARFKAPSKVPKHQKNVMTLKEKVVLPEMLKEGTSYATVASYYGINVSTIQYIKTKEVEIRKTVDASFCGSVKRFSLCLIRAS